MKSPFVLRSLTHPRSLCATAAAALQSRHTLIVSLLHLILICSTPATFSVMHMPPPSVLTILRQEATSAHRLETRTPYNILDAADRDRAASFNERRVGRVRRIRPKLTNAASPSPLFFSSSGGGRGIEQAIPRRQRTQQHAVPKELRRALAHMIWDVRCREGAAALLPFEHALCIV